MRYNYLGYILIILRYSYSRFTSAILILLRRGMSEYVRDIDATMKVWGASVLNNFDDGLMNWG